MDAIKLHLRPLSHYIRCMQSLSSSARGQRVSFWSQRSRLDRLGVVASCLCAVHCALGAVFVGVSGVAGSLFRDERLELIFLLCAVGLAVASVATGYRQHRSRTVVLFAMAGLSLLGVSRGIDGARFVEAASSVVGACLLIVGHSLNARLLHRLGTCRVINGCAAP